MRKPTQTSAPGEHSDLPTMKLITAATITKGVLRHIVFIFFVLGFHGYVTFELGCSNLWLATTGGCAHYLIIFICHKNCPQIPGHPNEPFSN
jgi:hypothetical protein